MSQFITDIRVSSNQAEAQKLLEQHFEQVKEKYGDVYLWFKKQPGVAPVTRIQGSFNEDMALGLTKSQYSKMNIAVLETGEQASLWFFKGSTVYDAPIVKLEVSTNTDDEALKMKLGFERAGCNVGNCGTKVYLWVKREKPTFICDITATNSYGSDDFLFQEGYTRIDETTNTVYCGSSSNFLWYRQSTDEKQAVTDLKITTDSRQYLQNHQEKTWTLVPANLNENTGGRAVYLWFKKETGEPAVKSMVVALLNWSDIQTYEKAGVDVIKENINEGNCGDPRYICFLTKQ